MFKQLAATLAALTPLYQDLEPCPPGRRYVIAILMMLLVAFPPAWRFCAPSSAEATNAQPIDQAQSKSHVVPRLPTLHSGPTSPIPRVGAPWQFMPQGQEARLRYRSSAHVAAVAERPPPCNLVPHAQ